MRLFNQMSKVNGSHRHGINIKGNMMRVNRGIWRSLMVLCTVLLLAGTVRSETVGNAAPLQGELIDHVWSGHPVSYSMLASRGYLFIAYFDSDRRLTLISRKKGEREWTKVFPEGVMVPKRKRMSNVTEWDSHNYLTMTLDRAGNLHLSGNMHCDPLIYYRTKIPLDITSIERVDYMTGRFEDSVTYPGFMRDLEGNLVFRYRFGSSGNGNSYYNVYDPDQKSWKPLLETPLLDGLGTCSAYGTGPRKGPDGKFHMLWMWRDTPNAGSNHTLTYARSPDLAHWETSDGKPCRLPMTPGQGDVIDPVPPFKGLINMCYALGFDKNQAPVVAYHKFDEAGRSQAYAARLSNDGKWMVRQLSDWDFRWDFFKSGSLNKDVSVRFAPRNADGTLNLNARVKGKNIRWRLDAETLEKLELLPKAEGRKRPKLAYSNIDFPGIQMNSTSAKDDGREWILQWETLDRNGGKPREKVPPLAELRLYSIEK